MTADSEAAEQVESDTENLHGHPVTYSTQGRVVHGSRDRRAGEDLAGRGVAVCLDITAVDLSRNGAPASRPASNPGASSWSWC